MDENGIDRQALAQNFVAEAADLLGQLEQDLVALEARPQDEEVLNALFRVAHTLKGSASLVGFDEVSEVAHAVEGLLERLRARSLPVTAPLVTLLLQSVDTLREAVAAAAAGTAASSPAGRSLRERLARATASGAERSPAAASHPEAEPQAALAPAARTLRVDLGKLDRLLDLAGEIGIARGRLTDMLERGASLSVEELLSAHRDADRLYLDLQDLIMKARMVPIGPTFHQHARTVRDLALAQGKQARLVVEGADAEVDTAVVEHIRDPLTHMVR
ncbi:MAG TPA: Hpt domain-containing protein, partial [Anaeromyxobacteraceae bacterium]|nr:Hpt domain-containing protein [Anaeromyxobacteraceae bacterium]